MKEKRILNREDLNAFLKTFGQSIRNFREDEVEMLFESENSLVLAQRKGLDLQKYIIPSKESLVELEGRLLLLEEDILGKFHVVHRIIGGDEFVLSSYDDQEEAVSEARDLVETHFKKIKSGKECIEIRFNEINYFDINSCAPSGYDGLDYGETMIEKAVYGNFLNKLWKIYDSNTLLDLKNTTEEEFDEMINFEMEFYQEICEKLGIEWGYEDDVDIDKWKNTDDMWNDIEKMTEKKGIDIKECELPLIIKRLRGEIEMKKYTQEELKIILEDHMHWLNQDCEGWENMKADLTGANLRGANFTGFKLIGVDFKGELKGL